MDIEKISSLIIFVLYFQATNLILVLHSEDNSIKPGFLEYKVL